MQSSRNDKNSAIQTNSCLKTHAWVITFERKNKGNSPSIDMIHGNIKHILWLTCFNKKKYGTSLFKFQDSIMMKHFVPRKPFKLAG